MFSRPRRCLKGRKPQGIKARRSFCALCVEPVQKNGAGKKVNTMKGHDVRPAKWSDVIDLYDDGEYSAIWGRYDGGAKRALGVRWNGDGDGKGFPLSSGHPVWHVEPDFLAKGILSTLLERTFAVPKSGGDREKILTAMEELWGRIDANRIHLAVALYAAGNRGKTTTLKKLIELLESAIGQNGDDGRYRVVEKKPYYDGSADMLFCCKYGGKTVGVATGGDNGDAQDVAFKFFDTYNCDIVFCATRSRSDSYSWETFEDKTSAGNVRVICIKKIETDDATEQETVNEAQASELMELIDLN